eukprot:31349-Pelagococcus_subviridis.AAC.7
MLYQTKIPYEILRTRSYSTDRRKHPRRPRRIAALPPTLLAVSPRARRAHLHAGDDAGDFPPSRGAANRDFAAAGGAAPSPVAFAPRSFFPSASARKLPSSCDGGRTRFASERALPGVWRNGSSRVSETNSCAASDSCRISVRLFAPGADLLPLLLLLADELRRRGHDAVRRAAEAASATGVAKGRRRREDATKNRRTRLSREGTTSRRSAPSRLLDRERRERDGRRDVRVVRAERGTWREPGRDLILRRAHLRRHSDRSIESEVSRRGSRNARALRDAPATRANAWRGERRTDVEVTRDDSSSSAHGDAMRVRVCRARGMPRSVTRPRSPLASVHDYEYLYVADQNAVFHPR